MRRLAVLWVGAVVALAMSGCTDWFPPNDSNGNALYEIRDADWCLRRFVHADGTTQSIDQSIAEWVPRARFGSGDTLSGWDGCLRYAGTFNARDGAMRATVWTTDFRTPPCPLYTAEFLQGMNEARSYATPTRDLLRITSASGTVLEFAKCR